MISRHFSNRRHKIRSSLNIVSAKLHRADLQVTIDAVALIVVAHLRVLSRARILILEGAGAPVDRGHEN